MGKALRAKGEELSADYTDYWSQYGER